MNSLDQSDANGTPNCWRCRYFAVSWDPAQPYACNLMGFKSRISPALEVLRADGRRCMGFSPKNAPVTNTSNKARGITV